MKTTTRYTHFFEYMENNMNQITIMVADDVEITDVEILKESKEKTQAIDIK